MAHNSSLTDFDTTRTSTGMCGLDTIFSDGLTRGRLYLLKCNPDVGKTAFAIRFLLNGIRNRGRALYITLSRTASELRAVAALHGWSHG